MKLLATLALGTTVLLSALTTQAVAQTKVTITPDQPSYRIGQTPSITVTGTPGHRVYFLAGAVKKDLKVPGIGTLCVDPWAPNSAIVIVGRIPSTGKLIFPCAVPCKSVFADLTAWVQAVTLDLITGKFQISNCSPMSTVLGDCKGACLGKVVVLGLQTSFKNGGTGKQTITIWAKKEKTTTKLTELKVVVDWSKPVSLPIYNSNKSIKITHIFKDGKNVTIRFDIDIRKANLTSFPDSTAVAALLDSICNLNAISTTCKNMVDVGRVFGHFTVTKYISVK